MQAEIEARRAAEQKQAEYEERMKELLAKMEQASEGPHYVSRLALLLLIFRILLSVRMTDAGRRMNEIFIGLFTLQINESDVNMTASTVSMTTVNETAEMCELPCVFYLASD